MPDNFVDTFNNVIPSHLMKFILWQDEEDLDVEVQDEPLYSDEEDEVAVDVLVDSEDLPEDKNLLFNNSGTL